MELANLHKINALDLLWLGVTVFLSFCFLLGSHPLIIPDEARYSEVAREMLVTHNFLTPMVDGIPFLDKPPLFYWIETLFIHLFGVNEWSVRIWPAIAATGGVLINYVLGCKLYTRRIGLMAALILATMLFYFAMAHFANLDLTVALFINASLSCILIAIQTPDKPNRSWLLIAYVFSGLAILTKGLIGIAFPAMILGIWILFLKRWRLLNSLKVHIGLPLILVMTLPWFIWANHQNPGLIHYIVIVQQFERFVGQQFNDHHGCWFYPTIVLLGTLPWTTYVCRAVVSGIRDQMTKQNPTVLFLLIWPLSILIFFSLPASKMAGYSLPLFAPLALLSAIYFDQQRFTHMTSAILFSMLGLCGFLIIYGPFHILSQALITTVWIFSSAFLLAAGLLWVCAKRASSLNNFLIVLSLGILINFNVILSISTEYQAAGLPTTLPVINTLKRHLKPGDIVVSYKLYAQDLPFYLHHTVKLSYNPNNPDINQWDTWNKEFAEGLKQKKYRALIWPPKKLARAWGHKRRIFLLVTTEQFPAFKAAMPTPVYQLDQYNGVILTTNQTH